MGSAEEGKFHRQAAYSAAARARSEGSASMNRANIKFGKCFDMKKFAVIVRLAALAFLLLQTIPAVAAPPKPPTATKPELAQQPAATDSDKTLAAMQDELDRSRHRLELKIPGTDKPAHRNSIQYRELDLAV